MHKVLFVSDDWTRKRELKGALLDAGLSLAQVSTAALLKEDFAPPAAELIVADLERVQVEVPKLCHLLRREPPLKDLPLILLVPEEQLGGLEFAWGIEDYLTLPVSPARLARRLAFILWRLHRIELKNGFISGGLVVDFERYEVHVHGAPADLTYKEFELLKFLVLNAGKAFTREALLSKVWGYDYYGGTRTVDVHIRRLRSKLETGGSVYLETVRNVGYKFVQPSA
ncbi:MAG TPA: response regulator transcription factor [bacterium]